MAKLHVGTIKLAAKAISPWKDYGFGADPADAYAPGPVSLNWFNITKGLLFFPASVSEIVLSDEVISSTLTGTFVNQDDSNGTMDKPSQYETAVARKGFTTAPFTRLSALPEKKSALELTRSTDYDDVPGVESAVTRDLAVYPPQLPLALQVKPTLGFKNLTLKLLESDFLPQFQKDYAYRVGSDLSIVGSQIQAAVKVFQERTTVLFNKDSNFEISNLEIQTSPKAYGVNQTVQQGWFAHAVQNFSLTPPPIIQNDGSFEIYILVDTDSLALSAATDLSDAQGVWPEALREMNRVNAELATKIKQANVGILENSEPLIRPAATTDEFLTPEQRRYTNDWWNNVSKVDKELIAAVSTMKPADALSAYNAAHGTALTLSELQALQKVPASAGNDLDWGALASTAGSWLKDAGSGALDLLKDWGPTGILTAWAGYEGIKSVKNSGIPAWLIFGGIGLAAFAIMK